MANRFLWPRCTYPGCTHVHSWKTMELAMAAVRRHGDWTEGDAAICYCHGTEGGATFPCDHTMVVTHHV